MGAWVERWIQQKQLSGGVAWKTKASQGKTIDDVVLFKIVDQDQIPAINKKRLHERCCPMDFAEFCKTAVCKRLLLKDTCFSRWNCRQIKIVANSNPRNEPH